MIKTFLGGLVATITGNAVWALALVNLLWLLVKNHTLFSWWWVIGMAIIFVGSLIVTFLNVLR